MSDFSLYEKERCFKPPGVLDQAPLLEPLIESTDPFLCQYCLQPSGSVHGDPPARSRHLAFSLTSHLGHLRHASRRLKHGRGGPERWRHMVRQAWTRLWKLRFDLLVMKWSNLMFFNNGSRVAASVQKGKSVNTGLRSFAPPSAMFPQD